jgi:hypothetical protein
MKLFGTVLTVIILIGSCEGLFNGGSLQDYVDNFIDTAKLKLEGVVNLNNSAIQNIWTYFKTKYHRVYSSFGL